jgi:hypothetical protein
MSTLNVSNISDGTDTVETGYVVNGSAKAFVHGDETAAILKSFNVSTGTDHGTGDYSYALVSAMDSNNYSMPCCVRSGTPDRNARRNSTRDSASVMAIGTSNARLNSNVDHIQNATLHGDLA